MNDANQKSASSDKLDHNFITQNIFGDEVRTVGWLRNLFKDYEDNVEIEFTVGTYNGCGGASIWIGDKKIIGINEV